MTTPPLRPLRKPVPHGHQSEYWRQCLMVLHGLNVRQRSLGFTESLLSYANPAGRGGARQKSEVGKSKLNDGHAIALVGPYPWHPKYQILSQAFHFLSPSPCTALHHEFFGALQPTQAQAMASPSSALLALCSVFGASSRGSSSEFWRA